MKKYFKQTQPHANLRGAMESGDHSKNGASPKSLMSRGKFLFMISFVLLAMGSCKKGNDNEPPSDEDLLVDATFYEGEYPQNGLIRYIDENNDEFNLYGFKGWVDVYFQDNINLEQASQMIISLNGEIIEKIPAINYYLVKVPEDTEADFIKGIRGHNVEYAYPRLIYRFSSCEHYTVIIDDFRETKESKDHGLDVRRMYDISSKDVNTVNTDPNIIWNFNAGYTGKNNETFTDITKTFNELCTDNYHTKANLVNISSAPRRSDYKDNGSFYEGYKAYLKEIIVGIKKIKQRRTDGGDIVVTIGAGNDNMLLYSGVIEPLKKDLSKDENDILKENMLIVGTNTVDKNGNFYSNGSAKDNAFAIVDIEIGWTDNNGDDGTSFAAPRVLGYINRIMNEVHKADGTCLTAVEALAAVKEAVADAKNTDGAVVLSEAIAKAKANHSTNNDATGFFAGTVFDNTMWKINDFVYTVHFNGTERYSEKHYDNNRNTYYTYHTKPYTYTDSYNYGEQYWQFRGNSLYLYNIEFMVFDGDSIRTWGEEGISLNCKNGIPFYENIDGEEHKETITVTVTGKNNFKLKYKNEWTYDNYSNYNSNYWVKILNTEEWTWEFEITSANTIKFIYTEEDITNNAGYGSEYTGIIRGERTETGTGYGSLITKMPDNPEGLSGTVRNSRTKSGSTGRKLLIEKISDKY
jgi:hypothetical protein